MGHSSHARSNFRRPAQLAATPFLQPYRSEEVSGQHRKTSSSRRRRNLICVSAMQSTTTWRWLVVEKMFLSTIDKSAPKGCPGEICRLGGKHRAGSQEKRRKNPSIDDSSAAFLITRRRNGSCSNRTSSISSTRFHASRRSYLKCGCTGTRRRYRNEARMRC